MVPHHPDTPRLVLVMVGLPARGKTYVAQKLARYLCWRGHRTRVFNVGNYRRERLGSHQGHEFFNPGNPEGRAALLQMAIAALDDMIGWLAAEGQVGIYDATNSTRERRAMVERRCREEGLDVVFIESICEDRAVIEGNVRDTKLRSPDYSDVDPEDAVRDFLARIAHYERAYETIDDDSASYIKLIDVGRQVVVNRIHGFLPARIVFFLMNLHVKPRSIFLTRHGESTHNEAGLIGGDAGLSARGDEYARSLARHLDARLVAEGGIIWTSTLRRTRETARYLTRPSLAWRALDEIDAGICDGMSYAQIHQTMPEEFAARSANKFRYRYPRGESYEDVILRLDPVIIELERESKPVLVIAHQAVLRALYAYLVDKPAEECPRLPIPLHTVLEIKPQAYGCEERRVALPPAPMAPASSSG